MRTNFEKIRKANRDFDMEVKGKKLNKVKRDRSAKRAWMEAA
ncbi:hypothetical protein [Salmonella phage vB_SenAt-pSL2]|uniref:Uncharacterized protein n=1 Tax=Escherichia phage UAB_Phi78 TaxID=979726 RepID=A0A9K0IFG0_9CAUD|nr:hypothetical protein I132_gp14 [Escherichia phage UAB_Phi78]ADW95216.1 hypothetical protein UAB78_014 [Escherichia phage UAB_Phi78]QZQ75060.1 hypothetical protein [Salmonella phage vB_SenAt-pSL2]HBL6576684.1 hypothetical protein [Salmonella enterica subsp. enterica serovar Typhimurium]